jgi:hypothetical protein
MAGATGADRPGHPFPVPPFERLQQRLAHGRAQPEPLGKIARHPAVRLHDLLHRAARGRQELPDQPDPPETRLTATEMAGDENRQRDTFEILIAGIGVQPDLITEQRRQLSGVHGAAHPRQQRRVIRRRAGRLIHPGRRPEPHRNNGLTQHPLHRPPHTKIGDKRQRRHQLGKSHPLQRIGSHHPSLPLMPVGRSADHKQHAWSRASAVPAADHPPDRPTGPARTTAGAGGLRHHRRNGEENPAAGP